MALERGKLSNVVTVGGGSTVGIVTVASSKKVYIKSVMVHNTGGAGGITSATGQVYFVPNGVGGGTTATRIFDVDVAPGETVLIEPSYPIVLDTTGDELQVGNSVVGNGALNFIITGDKEA